MSMHSLKPLGKSPRDLLENLKQTVTRSNDLAIKGMQKIPPWKRPYLRLLMLKMSGRSLIKKAERLVDMIERKDVDLTSGK